MGKQSRVEDYNPDDYQEDNEDFDLPLLSEMLGKTFTILGMDFNESGIGMYSLVKTDKGTYRTSSEVLIDRLKKMHDKVQSGIAIKISLQEGKSASTGRTYHCFDVPE